MVRYLIEHRLCDAMIKDNDDETPLFPACKTTENVDIALYLIQDLHLNVNTKNRFGETPLLKACFSGSKEMVQLLLSYPVNLYDVTLTGGSAVDVAVRYNYPDILRLLLQKDPNLVHFQKNSLSLIHILLKDID
eukprot:CAMPEP_0117420242 /NCGR_PEP_ID=MMETSP0758-20121206/1614_1 /TAXON_ID=63605 /ORGANISM="Percolomonas cosmopolitus, Strain AE-1 (ATCC 50343)" /LENGTH=133 /DNA_ID=CAMNT_0005201731 /DNA_START=711 /DNA_END=1112 /DNA_ORIENTATION=+